MFQSTAGEPAPAAQLNLPSFNQEAVRHILLGDYGALTDTITRLALLGYCEQLAWSEPLPTGCNGEFISVMTRKRTMA